jgi:hypothetical protein
MNDFIEIAKKQGFTTVLLLVIAWVLYSKIEYLETRIQNCEADKFQIIEKIVEKSNNTIDRNTQALERNTEIIDAILINNSAKSRKKVDPLTARQGISPTK